MYIKIYFDDKPLFLCDQIDEAIEPYLHHDDAIFIDELDTHTVKTMIREMEQPQVHAGVFLHTSLDELQQAFFKKFTLIRAAGGLVKNDKDQLLLIFRRGKWDLPKGKLDEGETLEACAVREVEEETGLKNIRLEGPLVVTWHTYHQGTRFVLKESHWYTMTAPGDQPLVPQTEEDILEIKWVPAAGLNEYTGNVFPAIIDVLQAGGAV
ncbi:MAG: NUDIX domain-containing protein [Chitinophagaceae bacterium]